MSGKMRLFMSVCIYFSLFSLLVSYALSQINFAQSPINSKFIQINPIQGNDNQSRLYGGPQAFDCIEKLLNEFRFNFDFDKLTTNDGKMYVSGLSLSITRKAPA